MKENELINFNNAKEIPPEYNGSEKKKNNDFRWKKILSKIS